MRDERTATTTGDPDETAIFALEGGLPLRRRPLPDHGTRDYDDGVPLTVGQQANRTPLLAHSIGEFDRWRPPWSVDARMGMGAGKSWVASCEAPAVARISHSAASGSRDGNHPLRPVFPQQLRGMTCL